MINGIAGSHVIIEVKNYIHACNERQAKNDIDRNVLTGCNGNHCISAVTAQFIGKMEHKGAVQHCSNCQQIVVLNNARQRIGAYSFEVYNLYKQ